MLNHPAIDVNATNKFDDNALHLAVQYDFPSKRIAMIELLIKHKANVNLPGRLGRTALMRTCATGDLKATKLLISHPYIDVKFLKNLF